MTSSEMSKMPMIKSSIYNHITKYVVVLILLALCFVAPSFAVVSIGSLLETVVEKQAMDGTLKQLPGRAGVSSLFKRSLDVVKSRDIQIIDTSVDAVVSEIHEQRSACAQSNYFSKVDAINILYYSASYGNIGRSFIPFAGNNVAYIRDVSFRRLIDQTIAADTNLSTPDVNDRNQSCVRLIQCQGGDTTEQVRLTLEVQVACENIVRSAYVKHMLTNRSYQTITDGTFGENLFQNGSLADSDYDLMVDIYNIGRILFQGYQPPVELVYYQFPAPAQAGGSATVHQLGSPIGAMGTMSVQAGPSSLRPSDLPDNFLRVGGVDVPNTREEDPIGPTPSDGIDDIFIEQTNTSTLPPIPRASPDVIIGANMCVVASDSPTPAVDQSGEQISFDVYQELLQDYYEILQEQQIIDNLISDSIALGPQSDPGDINTYNEERQNIEDQIASMIDDAFDFSRTPDDPTIQSCIQDCQGMPAVDYAVCTAKCLCGEVGSPSLSVNGFEIVEPNAFRVRFCQVPTSPTPVTRGRTIYSIEEIFDEMRNIFVSLRDSGELIKHVRTREFLDSAVSRNDFAKMFAFNIFVARKGTQDNTPANHYTEQLSVSNQKLQSALLSHGTNMASPHERNKYVMIDNPTVRVAIQQTQGDTAQALQAIEDLQRIADNVPQMQVHINLLEKQKSQIVNEAVLSFFINNFQFRDSVIDAFADFNGIAENLKNKIQRAQ